MVQNVYYIVASIGIIFTGFMGFLTYKLNKDTKESEKRTKNVAEEIKNIYETNNKNRIKSEAITKLLHLFSNLDSLLKNINKPDDIIIASGITIENTVNDISTIVLEIREYSFVFTDSNISLDTGSYTSLESLSNEHDYSFRKNVVNNALSENVRYKGFLRNLQRDI